MLRRFRLRWRRLVLRAVAAVALLGLLPVAAAPAAGSSEEFRAYWVDAFGEGLYTEDQIDALLAAVKAANLNTVVAQWGVGAIASATRR
jgi:uncharacterized lipoprotein YddW (UPF0748 family)